MLNRKKSQNALEKGFTLVELMIVIVIVGILSAVALPNFLNQTNKAKATEAKTQISSLLKQTAAESLETNINTAVASANVATTGPVAVASGAGEWTYTLAGTTTNGYITVQGAPTTGGSVVGTPNVYGCANPTSGAIEIGDTAFASGC